MALDKKIVKSPKPTAANPYPMSVPASRPAPVYSSIADRLWPDDITFGASAQLARDVAIGNQINNEVAASGRPAILTDQARQARQTGLVPDLNGVFPKSIPAGVTNILPKTPLATSNAAPAVAATPKFDPSAFMLDNPLYDRQAQATIGYWKKELGSVDADYQRQRAEIEARYKFADTKTQQNALRKQLASLDNQALKAKNNLQTSYDYAVGRSNMLGGQQQAAYNQAAANTASNMATAQTAFMGATTGPQLSPAAQAALATATGYASNTAAALNAQGQTAFDSNMRTASALDVARLLAQSELANDASHQRDAAIATHTQNLADQEAQMTMARNQALDSLLASRSSQRQTAQQGIAQAQSDKFGALAKLRDAANEKALAAKAAYEAEHGALTSNSPMYDRLYGNTPMVLSGKKVGLPSPEDLTKNGSGIVFEKPGDATSARYLTQDDLNNTWNDMLDAYVSSAGDRQAFQESLRAVRDKTSYGANALKNLEAAVGPLYTYFDKTFKKQA